MRQSTIKQVNRVREFPGFYLFVLNVAEETPVMSPVLVSGNSQGQSYTDSLRKQRSSFVLTPMQGRKTGVLTVWYDHRP